MTAAVDLLIPLVFVVAWMFVDRIILSQIREANQMFESSFGVE
jgi:hypothetical protein